MLEQMIQSGEFFAVKGNMLISVQDLLTRKLGRHVGYDEAVKVIQNEQTKLKKSQFISTLIRKSHENA